MNDKDKSTIKTLFTRPEFRSIENLANYLVQRIREEPKVRETEWETIRETLTQEGQVAGIKRLLQEVYNISHEQK
ncbi:MAG: hypothetical protein WAV09_01640 [Minisyncoccia bacterium]